MCGVYIDLIYTMAHIQHTMYTVNTTTTHRVCNREYHKEGGVVRRGVIVKAVSEDKKKPPVSNPPYTERRIGKGALCRGKGTMNHRPPRGTRRRAFGTKGGLVRGLCIEAGTESPLRTEPGV